MSALAVLLVAYLAYQLTADRVRAGVPVRQALADTTLVLSVTAVVALVCAVIVG